MDSEKGLIIIYTGEGKGKTTAALGLVLRKEYRHLSLEEREKYFLYIIFYKRERVII